MATYYVEPPSTIQQFAEDVNKAPNRLPDTIVDEESDLPTGCTCHWEKKSSMGEDFWWVENYDSGCVVHFPHKKVYCETLTDEFVADNVNEEFAERVNNYLADLGDLLIAKNKAYGDSALNPIRVFSKASAEEQLLVRIDDKISRIARGHEYADEDTVKDLCGYLVLLHLAREDSE